MLDIVNRLSGRRAFAALLATSALIFLLIGITLFQLQAVSGGYGILDFEFGYSLTRVHEVLGSYGQEGMQLYTRIQLLDLLNPALYSLVLAVLTSKAWRDLGPKWLALLPLLAGAGDYAENATLFLITKSYPEVSQTLVDLSSNLSMAKNMLMLVAVAPLVVGIGIRLTQKASRSRDV